MERVECSRSPDYVVGGVALAFEQQVGFADRVGLSVDLLAELVDRYLLAAIFCNLIQDLLAHRQHAAGAAGPVVDQVGAVGDLVGNRQEDQVGHELHPASRGVKCLSRFLVVLLVEASDQLLEDGPHRVVVEAGLADRAVVAENWIGAQVDLGGGEFLYQRAERVRPREPRDLVAEFEVVEDVLDVRGETVQVILKVGLELLVAGSRTQAHQGKLRSVVERLPGRLPQRGILFDDFEFVESGAHFEHVLLGGFQHCVKSAQHGHRKDDIAVFPTHVNVAQDIICNPPDVICDPVEVGCSQGKDTVSDNESAYFSGEQWTPVTTTQSIDD